MGHFARGEVWIPLEEWYEFVSRFAPVTTGEVSYGPPIIRDVDLVVPFAINTDCNPMDEVKPPEWTTQNG